jgi:hypothetical protein
VSFQQTGRFGISLNHIKEPARTDSLGDPLLLNHPMVKINIGFTDLQEEVQEEVWALVSKQLMDGGCVQHIAGERDDDFQDRLWAATDTYLTTHALALS